MKLVKMLPVMLLSVGLVFAQTEKSITLDVQNADIKTVLRAFSDVANINIVTTKNVSGEVTFHVKNVPWKEAFRALLDAYSLSYVESKGIITVMTQSEYSKVRDISGLEMKIVPIKYSSAKKLKPVLESLLSSRGKIKIEETSNSLVVTDLPENITKIEDFVTKVDKPVEQVSIVAKVVEVDYDAARQLGSMWQATNAEYPGTNTGYVVKNDAQIGGPATTLNLGRIRRTMTLNLQLQSLESESKANILSQPSILIANNQKAEIISGKKIPVVTRDISGNSVVQFYDAAIKLDVTPHITPDGNIAMNLHPQVSDIAGYSPTGQPIISNQEAKTQLTVKDGETVVIGGVVKSSTKRGNAGFPFLRKIPIINLFFGRNENSKSKVELMIFVTPTIVKETAEIPETKDVPAEEK